MSRPRRIIAYAVEVVAIGGVCFVLFAMLLPPFEAGLTEARLVTAYNDVRQISDAYRQTPTGDVFTTHELPDRDPWGTPYRLVSLDDGQVRVLSSGPNNATQATGVDDDDIYSDMPESPVAPIHAKKHRQTLMVVAGFLGTWLLLSTFHVRARMRLSGRESP